MPVGELESFLRPLPTTRAVGEDHLRYPRTDVKVDHPIVADTDAAKASITRLVDLDQTRGDVNSIANEMP